MNSTKKNEKLSLLIEIAVKPSLIFYHSSSIKFIISTADIIINEVTLHKGDGAMDIPALSISMNQASLSQQVGIAIAKKVMDTSEESAQAITKMMELSINPNLGSKIDVSV